MLILVKQHGRVEVNRSKLPPWQKKIDDEWVQLTTTFRNRICAHQSKAFATICQRKRTKQLIFNTQFDSIVAFSLRFSLHPTNDTHNSIWEGKRQYCQRSQKARHQVIPGTQLSSPGHFDPANQIPASYCNSNTLWTRASVIRLRFFLYVVALLKSDPV